jgi:hypothetical protein
MDDHATAWAEAEFGHATLGDVRRTRRIVDMAGQLATQPAGRISAAFPDAADREAAFRAVENDHYSYEDLGWSMRQATAQRAAAFSEVIVPIDGASLAVAYDGPGFGPVSNKGHGNGVQAMTALALAPDGVPLGILGQQMWTRSSEHSPANRRDKRPIEERETGNWLTVMSQAREALRRHAPSTKPWFQLDRGGDCATVLLHALGADVTVRACYDRCVTGGKLWAKAAAGTYLGKYNLRIAKPSTAPRIATIFVRARPVELILRMGLRGRGPVQLTRMWVVEARELGTGCDRVLWRLLTTKPVTTFATAYQVISAYTRRWRIEEFHRAWKSGACGIEQSWLRQLEHYCKWATLLAAVAARLERIKLLSRTEPERSALEEFTRDEIDATILLRKPKGVELGATPTLGQVTLWIAELGSYTGKSSGGPPGITVITRGFARVEAAAEAIVALRNLRKKRG